MGWPNEESVRLPFWEIMELESRGFDSWSSQTNDLKIDVCCLLVRRSALLGYGKDWLAQCQANLTEWDIRSWCLPFVFPSVAL